MLMDGRMDNKCLPILYKLTYEPSAQVSWKKKKKNIYMYKWNFADPWIYFFYSITIIYWQRFEFQDIWTVNFGVHTFNTIIINT